MDGIMEDRPVRKMGKGVPVRTPARGAPTAAAVRTRRAQASPSVQVSESVTTVTVSGVYEERATSATRQDAVPPHTHRDRQGSRSAPFPSSPDPNSAFVQPHKGDKAARKSKQRRSLKRGKDGSAAKAKGKKFDKKAEKRATRERAQKKRSLTKRQIPNEDEAGPQTFGVPRQRGDSPPLRRLSSRASSRSMEHLSKDELELRKKWVLQLLPKASTRFSRRLPVVGVDMAALRTELIARLSNSPYTRDMPKFACCSHPELGGADMRTLHLVSFEAFMTQLVQQVRKFRFEELPGPLWTTDAYAKLDSIHSEHLVSKLKSLEEANNTYGLLFPSKEAPRAFPARAMAPPEDPATSSAASAQLSPLAMPTRKQMMQQLVASSSPEPGLSYEGQWSRFIAYCDEFRPEQRARSGDLQRRVDAMICYDNCLHVLKSTANLFMPNTTTTAAATAMASDEDVDIEAASLGSWNTFLFTLARVEVVRLHKDDLTLPPLKIGSIVMVVPPSHREGVSYHVFLFSGQDVTRPPFVINDNTQRAPMVCFLPTAEDEADTLVIVSDDGECSAPLEQWEAPIGDDIAEAREAQTQTRNSAENTLHAEPRAAEAGDAAAYSVEADESRHVETYDDDDDGGGGGGGDGDDGKHSEAGEDPEESSVVEAETDDARVRHKLFASATSTPTPAATPEQHHLDHPVAHYAETTAMSANHDVSRTDRTDAQPLSVTSTADRADSQGSAGDSADDDDDDDDDDGASMAQADSHLSSRSASAAPPEHLDKVIENTVRRIKRVQRCCYHAVGQFADKNNDGRLDALWRNLSHAHILLNAPNLLPMLEYVLHVPLIVAAVALRHALREERVRVRGPETVYTIAERMDRVKELLDALSTLKRDFKHLNQRLHDMQKTLFGRAPGNHHEGDNFRRLLRAIKMDFLSRVRDLRREYHVLQKRETEELCNQMTIDSALRCIDRVLKREWNWLGEDNHVVSLNLKTIGDCFCLLSRKLHSLLRQFFKSFEDLNSNDTSPTRRTDSHTSDAVAIKRRSALCLGSAVQRLINFAGSVSNALELRDMIRVRTEGNFRQVLERAGFKESSISSIDGSVWIHEASERAMTEEEQLSHYLKKLQSLRESFYQELVSDGTLQINDDSFMAPQPHGHEPVFLEVVRCDDEYFDREMPLSRSISATSLQMASLSTMSSSFTASDIDDLRAGGDFYISVLGVTSLSEDNRDVVAELRHQLQASCADVSDMIGPFTSERDMQSVLTNIETNLYNCVVKLSKSVQQLRDRVFSAKDPLFPKTNTPSLINCLWQLTCSLWRSLSKEFPRVKLEGHLISTFKNLASHIKQRNDISIGPGVPRLVVEEGLELLKVLLDDDVLESLTQQEFSAVQRNAKILVAARERLSERVPVHDVHVIAAGPKPHPSRAQEERVRIEDVERHLARGFAFSHAGRTRIQYGEIAPVGRVVSRDAASSVREGYHVPEDSTFHDQWRQIAVLRRAQMRDIGEGAYGRVFVATNLTTNQPMAVKEVYPKYVMSNEWKLTRHLRHENVVESYGMQVHPGRYYLFMEYVPGGTLKQLLLETTALSYEETSGFTKDIAQGIDYLHRNRVVHRDIKPGNLLLTRQGTIKICDFGQCLSLDDVDSLTLNDAGFGTAPYQPPEFGDLEALKRFPCKIDVWELGCCVLDMLDTPVYPNNLRNTFLIVSGLHEGRLTPNMPARAEPTIIDFLRGCFALDPQRRSSASDLLMHAFLQRSELHT